MSTTSSRITLTEAADLALEVVELLRPFCARIEIAGSIRRRRPTIGDLELVTIPLLQTTLDLFGDEAGQPRNELDERCAELIADGIFGRRPDKNGLHAVGARYKRLTYGGRGLDLFSVLSPAQWGVIFLIRTGSAEFSHRLVTPTEHGGWMPRDCYVRDGALWRGKTLLPTPEEEDVFRCIDRPYVQPTEREVS